MTKKSQVWIESVLYTLIGLALIGVALAIVTPKITDMKDRAVVEQTIDSLGAIDLKIGEVVEKGSGNRRIIEGFGMKKGEMFINASGDKITFVLRDLRKPYSEPGVKTSDGRVEILSESTNKENLVYLTLSYENINLTYGKSDNLKKFNAAPTPYRFSVENLGKSGEEAFEVINIEETSG